MIKRCTNYLSEKDKHCHGSEESRIYGKVTKTRANIFYSKFNSLCFSRRRTNFFPLASISFTNEQVEIETNVNNSVRNP